MSRARSGSRAIAGRYRQPAPYLGVALTRWPKAIIRLSVWNSSEQVVSVISRWPGRCAGCGPPLSGFFGTGVEDPHPGERDDQRVRVGVEPVGVGVGDGLHDHPVAGSQLGHPAQRLAVGDPVGGERVVADLARVGGAGEVAVAAGEHVGRGALQHRHDVLLAELRDPDQRRGLALGDVLRLELLQRRAGVGPLLLQVAGDLALLAVRGPVGAPELPADVAEQDQPGQHHHQTEPVRRTTRVSPGSGHALIVSARA